METQYLQNVRYKLQKRIRRLNGCDWQQFIFVLRQFWVFFDSNPLLVSIAQELTAKYADYHESAAKIFGQTYVVGENEEESAAIAYGVLRHYVAQDRPDAVMRYMPGHPTGKFDE